MFLNYRTEGIFLKKTNRGEADQLFTVFTKDFGRIEVLGRAIRKIKSKLRVGADLFYFSKIEFVQGKSYKILTDTVLVEKFDGLLKDADKFKVALRIAEILDISIKGQEKDTKILKLVVGAFKTLDGLRFDENASRKDNLLKLGGFYYYFLWNFFLILGYGPQLYHCIFCRNKLTPQKIYFSLKDGGTVCRDCAGKAVGAKSVNVDLIKILRLVTEKKWDTFSRLKIDPACRNLFYNISSLYLKNILQELNNLS